MFLCETVINESLNFTDCWLAETTSNYTEQLYLHGLSQVNLCRRQLSHHNKPVIVIMSDVWYYWHPSTRLPVYLGGEPKAMNKCRCFLSSEQERRTGGGEMRHIEDWDKTRVWVIFLNSGAIPSTATDYHRLFLMLLTWAGDRMQILARKTWELDTEKIVSTFDVLAERERN